jgi:hypothetical protein
MSQEITASPAETLRFLVDYRGLTHKLYEKLRVSTVEVAQIDDVSDLLAERERLIEGFGQRNPDQSVEGLQALVVEIQQMDQAVSNYLRVLLHGTQTKMQGVQEQKRGTNAYQNDYAPSAVFFDRKK